MGNFLAGDDQPQTNQLIRLQPYDQDGGYPKL